ncbi:riboflavin synthase [Thiobacter aerophilum]|uniref:Riboflavin synthase n=1 Tax=Thiobacter aerophilum TaxID=3121275 RepID=A0ABV0EI64_9BURK
MFTGIVQAVGRVVAAEPLGDGLRLTIEAGALDLSDIALGDSIAANGVCLTVVAREGSRYWVDVSGETLRCTTGFRVGQALNLEKALRLSDRLGGHLVSGHVDGVGVVTRFEPVGGSHLMEVAAPPTLARYIAVKGSITVDGVSLTVNQVEGERFRVNVIPHTLAVTTFGGLAPKTRVNLEVDLLARYVERLLSYRESVA